MNADPRDRLTAARERIARLERELAAARGEVRVLEGAEAPGVTAASPIAVKIALFRERFAGRTDVYAPPWTSRTSGKKGWSPAVPGGFYCDDAELLALDDAAVDRHLRGDPSSDREFHIGLYPMLPGDRCRLLACDFDGDEAGGDAAAFVAAARDVGVDALTEISRSGNGAHVWIFFDSPVTAADARALGARLLRSAMATRPTLGMASYDRFFPAQDTLPVNAPKARFRLGNLIALPLQGDCRRRGTTVFADPATWQPYDDQFAALAAIAPVTGETLAALVASVSSIGPSDTVARPRRAGRRRVVTGDVPIEIGRGALVHVPLAGVPGSVISELKHVSSIANPEFYRRQAQRVGTFGIPRVVTSFEHDEHELRLPRGLLDQAVNLLSEAGFRVTTRIRSTVPDGIDIGFTGQLRPEQQRAVDALLAHDTGVLVAPPGAGKTVIACALIAERATPTAILVNRAELVQQWRDRLTGFLDVTDKQLGELGAGRRKRRGIVDLIMMQSISGRSTGRSSSTSATRWPRRRRKRRSAR